MAFKCKHRETGCNSCGKKEHLAGMCRSKQRRSCHFDTTRYVDMSQAVTAEEVVTIDSSRTLHIKAQLKLAGQDVTMEVDTGGSVSFMLLQQWKRLQLPMKWNELIVYYASIWDS